MGYYTRFKLKTNSDKQDEIIETLRDTVEYASMALDFNGNTNESCKWYDCEEDLKRFSVAYQDVLFTIQGVGEEAGDLWCLYVKNGKSQRCEAKIVYQEFDEKNLK